MIKAVKKISKAVNLAGIKLATSSSLADAQPKYLYLGLR
jgi:hypothetical protein